MGKRKKQTLLHRLNRWWLRYEYKHTTFAVLGIVLFVSLLDSAFLAATFSFLEDFGYLGGLIAGVLSASFFTAVPAVVLVVDLATTTGLDPLLLALTVGAGSAIGDMLLLLFFEERIFYELRPLFKKLRLSFLVQDKRRKRTSLPLLLSGAAIIVTPLPDEIGLGLLGISHFPKAFIFVICLALNTLGAALVIAAAQAIAA